MYVNWDALDSGWRAALEEGWEAYRAGTNPVGASLVDGAGEVVARGRNRIRDLRAEGRQLAGNRLAHAEINALLEASAWGGDPRELTLFTTVEPCPLCAGAILMANLKVVRFAARDPWAGSAALFRATPYVISKGVSAIGPRDDLEIAVKSMSVDYLLGSASPRAGEVVAAVRATLPRAAVAGEILHRTGALRAIAASGADAAEALRRVIALCGEVARLH